MNARDAQVTASNPRVSAFVSANAGSGKTTTLVSRVARLLLGGARPETLLCVTYTKAAAAEMQRRLFEDLGKWSVLESEALKDALAELEGRGADAYDEEDLSRARRLFAKALETPGGLKIQTIHAFCEKLLKRFPIEAGVSPGFEVIDDAGAAELAAEARDAVAREAFGEGLLAQAYERFAVALAFDDFEAMFTVFEHRREALARWIGGIGGMERLPETVAALVGLERLQDPEALERDAVNPPAFDTHAWFAAARSLALGSDADRRRGLVLQAVAEAAEAGIADVETVRGLFFTGAGEPRKSLATRAIDPTTCAWLVEEQERLAAAFQTARAARVAADTVHAMVLAAVYVREYEAAKARRRVLDFSDLVDRARSLLTERTDAAWVLFKLDGGIDHILIDEAQDTAPEQWEMLRALTSDFFSGAGAERREARVERSLFLVGDEKQSIFSFQGAAPERLRIEAAFYETRALALGPAWARVPLLESWRSTPEVLGFVDAVFRPPELKRGIAPDSGDEDVQHIALRIEHAGCVDLWPLEREAETPELPAWDEPVDARVPGAWRRLAERIADEIEALLKRGEQVHDRKIRGYRAANPGDVLVLVRKRAVLFEEVLRALKRRGVPVAGADRLKLSEHPVFEDALALARLVQFPDDDLTLAAVLRSPFADLDEDSLFHLAWGRKGSLRQALAARAEERAEWDRAHRLLDWVREEARLRTPFDLFNRLFARLDEDKRSFRARFMTRLGPEAGDAIDALLAQVGAVEQRGHRDLESVVHALARLDLTIKREMDEPRGEVRVMTAHGSKGLEAPIVFLPETVSAQEPRGSALLELPGAGFLWCASGKNDCDASAAARQWRKDRARDEDLRLLYVALTRARDRVVLAGRARQPPKTKAEELKGWYPLVEAAFREAAIAPRVTTVNYGGMEVQRYGPDPRSGGDAAAPGRTAVALPDWAALAPAEEARATRWASPTDLAEIAKVPSPSPLADTGGLRRFRRGELIHRLFQLLPDLAAADRAAGAEALLAREPDLTPEQRAEMTQAVLAVLDDPRFAEVFGPGSRPEVAVAGSAAGLPDGVAISGRLDRLVIGPERVLVIDYKTNRPAPDRAEDADFHYLAQMAVYVAVLRSLYPDRQVAAALIWTDGPKLTVLSDALVESTLRRIRGEGTAS